MRPKIEHWGLNFRNWSPAGDSRFVCTKPKICSIKARKQLFAILANENNKETDHFFLAKQLAMKTLCFVWKDLQTIFILQAFHVSICDGLDTSLVST